MGTTSDKLLYLNGTKVAIHDAIVAKGVTVPTGTPFRDYATKISEIPSGGAAAWSQSGYDTAYADAQTAYVRPADWLTMPYMSSSEDKIVGLHAVYPSGNFCSLVCAGDYTVDWGDGVVENFTANTQAYHTYNYDTFDMGGSTLCSRGYKQALVTITPQAGSYFTTINLHKKHNAIYLSTYSSGFLDLIISAPSVSLLLIGTSALNSQTVTIRFSDLESVRILSHALPSTSYLFGTCSSLKVVSISNTSAVTNMSGMFYACTSLTVPPYFNTSNATDVSYLFGFCRSLTYVPQYNTVSATNVSYMFTTCVNMKVFPNFNTANAITMDGMFASCSAMPVAPDLNTVSATSMTNMFSSCAILEAAPNYNLSNNTSMSGMFNGCSKLKTVPQYDTSKVTNMTSTFNACVALETIPLLDTSQVTFTTSMFSGCFKLKSIPQFNMANVTNASSMFNSCSVLQTIPLLNTSKLNNVTTMFQNCYSLVSLPALNFSTVDSNTGSIFSGCAQLSNIDIYGFRTTISVASCKLSTTALNKLLNNTWTSGGTKTLTISSNYGLDTAVTKTCGITAGSNVITVADTSSLTVGMPAIGTQMSYNTVKTATATNGSSTVTLASHGLQENTPLGLSTVNPEAKTLPSAAWQSIAYGAGKFVAVSGTTTAAYSTDGITWTSMTMPVSGWSTVAYGGGKFIAANSTTTMAYSTDGINWSTSSIPLISSPSICYGNGMFIITSVYNGGSGTTSTYYTSTDGINWTAGTFPFAANWTTCAYGNGVFVAGSTSNTVVVSSDGVNWTSKLINNLAYVASVAYGNGVWVGVTGWTAVGNVSSTNWIMSLDNGNTWTLKNNATASTSWVSVTYGNGMFIAVGGRINNTNAAMYSTDGQNWIALTMPSIITWTGVAAGGGTAVAVSMTGGSTASTTGALFNICDLNMQQSKTYYAVNVSSNTFSLSETPYGSPITLSSPSGSTKVMYRAGSVITSITPNTSITVSAPAVTTASANLTFRPELASMLALVKNWAITY